MYEIFVSIAAYKDDLLIDTINNLYEKAKNPSSIRTVVLNQTDYNEYNHHNYDFGNNKVEIYSVNYKHTKGVCWARHKIQSFIENERYYLQIDAHMRFAQDWDTKLIQYLKKCNSTKPIISYYPPAFDESTLICNNEIIKNEIRGLNLYACSSLGFVLNKDACNLDNGDNFPIPGTTIAAGFLFASIEYVKKVPYDPNIFWNYEESDQTYRLFTNGWSVFGLPECIIWHKYNTTGVMKHYVENSESMHRENKSNEYAYKKYFEKNDNDAYMLGDTRTLNEYEILNNINFKDKTFNQPKNIDILIVVPYRNREEHLKEFLEKTPKYFDDRNISYEILIAELDEIGDWNAGLCCNSMINFKKRNNYKYIYIHHVDIYPISGDWVYPADDELFFNLGDYGSCITTMNNFLLIGGYRNTFWSWGAEDNDLYAKCMKYNIKVTDIKSRTDINVVFDEKNQNHERKFVAINYANNIQTLRINHDRNVNSLFDTNHYGVTHSLEIIKDKIYKHKITPLHCAPYEYKNKNVVVSYIKNISEQNIYVFIKSVALFASYNYDIYIIDSSNVENSHITSQLEGFGAVIIKRKDIISTNICIDRLYAYQDFVKKYKYEKYLFTDFTDVFFQGNPFELIQKIDTTKIIVISEGTIIKDQLWNYNMLCSLYPKEHIDIISDYEVLNGGIICGNHEQIIDYTQKIINEYNSLDENTKNLFGIDQPIMMKLIYINQSLSVNSIRENIPLAINLHTVVHDADKNRFNNIKIVNNILVYNSNSQLFKIVHQYNRHEKLNESIIKHFNAYFTPTW